MEQQPTVYSINQVGESAGRIVLADLAEIQVRAPAWPDKIALGELHGVPVYVVATREGEAAGTYTFVDKPRAVRPEAVPTPDEVGVFLARYLDTRELPATPTALRAVLDYLIDGDYLEPTETATAGASETTSEVGPFADGDEIGGAALTAAFLASRDRES